MSWAIFSADERAMVFDACAAAGLGLAACVSSEWHDGIRAARERRTPQWRLVDDHADVVLDADEGHGPLCRASLARACCNGDVESLREHLAAGIPCDGFMYKKESPSGLFHTGPNPPLHFAIQGMHVACVRELLAAGATMLHFDDYGNGAYGNGLMCSACKNKAGSPRSLDMVKMLTELGVPRWGPLFCRDEYSGYHSSTAEVEARQMGILTRWY